MSTPSLYQAGYDACMAYAYDGIKTRMLQHEEWIHGWNVAVVEIANRMP